MLKKTFGVLVLMVVLSLNHAYADQVASFYDGSGTETNFGGILGWYFTPTVPLTVSALGIYDLGEPGFLEAHDIGIFLIDGTEIVSTSIGSGLSGTLMNGTRFVPIASTNLTAGTGYYIVANRFNSDLFAFGNGHVTYIPEVMWNGEGGGPGNDIHVPFTNFVGEPGNLGPNLQVAPLLRSVPEPSTLALLGAVAALLAVHRAGKFANWVFVQSKAVVQRRRSDILSS